MFIARQVRRDVSGHLAISLTVFGARFSSACCFMNSARSIDRVVGMGAATRLCGLTHHFLWRRTASASVAPVSLRIQIRVTEILGSGACRSGGANGSRYTPPFPTDTCVVGPGIRSRHLMLGSLLKSSRHPAGALPVLEGVRVTSTVVRGVWQDVSLLQHRVDAKRPMEAGPRIRDRDFGCSYRQALPPFRAWYSRTRPLNFRFHS